MEGGGWDGWAVYNLTGSTSRAGWGVRLRGWWWVKCALWVSAIWNLVRMIRVDNAHTVGVCFVRRRNHGNHYQN